MTSAPLSFIFLAILGTICAFAAPRKATIALMYWIVIVGAVRKWFLPQLADLLFFTPHLMLIGVYANLFFVRRKKIHIDPILRIFFIFQIIWGMISVFNPHLPDLRVGVLGLIIHFYFIPLAFFIPRLFGTKNELQNFLKNFAFFSIPILILGIVQFFSPVDSPLNQYVSETAGIAVAGSYPRITGTFSYIAGYTNYLNVLFLVVIYLLSISNVTLVQKVILSLVLVLVIINVMMTGSRGPMGVIAISGIMYLLAASKLGIKTTFQLVAKSLILMALIAGAVSSSRAGQEALKAIMFRTEKQTDLAPRIIDTITPLKFFNDAGFIGWGIGSTYQGSSYFVKDWGTMNRDFEEEPERILLELGLIGYFLVYFGRLLLAFRFWRLFNKLRSVDMKLLALIIFLFQLQFLQLMSLTFNFTNAVFYWFFIGFMFLLPELDRKTADI